MFLIQQFQLQMLTALIFRFNPLNQVYVFNEFFNDDDFSLIEK